MRHNLYTTGPGITVFMANQPTNQPTIWNAVLSEKLMGQQLGKIFPVFYGT